METTTIKMVSVGQDTIFHLKGLSERIKELSWDILEADDDSIDEFLDSMPKVRQIELVKAHNSMESAYTNICYLIENLIIQESERLKKEVEKFKNEE